MDLARFLQVTWRFRLLLATGLLLATLVSVVSLVRITSSGVEYREQETYLTASTLLITQKGFPWGRAVLDEMIPIDAEGVDEGDVPKELTPRFGDPGRYSGLAAIYAELAKGDAVQAQVLKRSDPGEYYETMVVAPPGVNASLPMIYIKGYGPSPEAAEGVAQRASKAFINYLNRQQAAAGIPVDKRVDVLVTQKATPPELFQKRSMVRPIFMFLLISMGFLALAFALENLRPRARPHPQEVVPVERPARAA
jgi:hypothetical protein